MIWASVQMQKYLHQGREQIPYLDSISSVTTTYCIDDELKRITFMNLFWSRELDIVDRILVRLLHCHMGTSDSDLYRKQAQIRKQRLPDWHKMSPLLWAPFMCVCMR